MNPELRDFCKKWIDKANSQNGDDISVLFDKFFYLYPVYNKLYVEASHELDNRGEINLDPDEPFPDSTAATSNVLKYLGCKNIEARLGEKIDLETKVQSFENIIAQNLFNICLNPATGNPDVDKENRLLAKLRANGCNDKMSGVLEFIYEVRCNVIHGRKGYEVHQVLVLEPVVEVLNILVLTLFDELT
ncbi:hypothetical protein [Fodinibius sp. AD559]|uniref:hypothetical protein n=1 Tax=Fodinibius sp. AD559 TaxID=3424179 RepID=UPI004046DC59